MPIIVSPEVAANPYGYTPTKSACLIFAILFLLSFLTHVFQAFKYKQRWLLITAGLCALLEFLGWASRLWSSYNMSNRLPFKLQLVFTIVAPTPLLAVNFVVVGRLIRLLGPQYSRLSPRWYTIVFLTCDVTALLTQLLGGVIAATADDPTNGGHVMLAGISFQFAAISIFCLVTGEYVWRWTTFRPLRASDAAEGGKMVRNVRFLVYALCFNTVWLYIRAIYRLAELVDGWTGHIIRTEWYFIVFEGIPIVFALWTWNFVHPGAWMPEKVERRVKDERRDLIALESV
ncbi:RTA1-like protein [Flagelloscypha sp. PMI_526]|nr:RTA1-like protein [Flagelloscypha sp. PMI_526]